MSLMATGLITKLHVSVANVTRISRGRTEHALSADAILAGTVGYCMMNKDSHVQTASMQRNPWDWWNAHSRRLGFFM